MSLSVADCHQMHQTVKLKPQRKDEGKQTFAGAFPRATFGERKPRERRTQPRCYRAGDWGSTCLMHIQGTAFSGRSPNTASESHTHIHTHKHTQRFHGLVFIVFRQLFHSEYKWQKQRGTSHSLTGRQSVHPDTYHFMLENTGSCIGAWVFTVYKSISRHCFCSLFSEESSASVPADPC